MTDRERITLERVRSHFEDRKKCMALLERARWPHEVICRRCHCEGVWRVKSRDRHGRERLVYVCKNCHHRYAVTAGTVFEGTRLRFDFWYAWIWNFVESRQDLRPSWVKTHFYVTYKTAWRVTTMTRREMRNNRFRRLIRLIQREAQKGLRAYAVPRDPQLRKELLKQRHKA